MSRTAAARSVDLEPIDRLEEKVKMLVAMIGRLKADQARAAEENARLSRELESARAQNRRIGGGPRRSRRAAHGARDDSRPRLRHARNSWKGSACSETDLDDSTGLDARGHMPEPQVVSVEIRGQRYPIRSELDAQYVNGLATYVDEKMRAAVRIDAVGRLAAPGGARGAEHRRRVVPLPGRAAGAAAAPSPSAPKPSNGSSTRRLPPSPEGTKITSGN